MRPAFVFDVNRCTGCQACQLACTIENDLEPDRSWRAINTFNERRHPDIPLFHLSLACNHCAEPACMNACPALAYSVDASSGAVLIDEKACIGCGYCAWACPFDAPRFDHQRGVMTKCTFCNHRLSEGLEPACAALCPTGALTVTSLPDEALSQPIDGFPPSRLRPALKVIPLRRSVGAAASSMGIAAEPMGVGGPSTGVVETPAGEPATTPTGTAEARAGLPIGQTVAVAEKKISLKKKWPLAIFTWLATLMFAMLVSFAAANGALPGVSASIEPAGIDSMTSAVSEGQPLPRLSLAGVFVATALLAMLLGGAHLGRKARAWRIVLNVAGSPLSREIVAFGLFAGLGSACLLWAPHSRWIALLSVAAGVLALLAIEDVYRYALPPVPRLPHSANVVLTGAFLAAALSSGIPWAGMSAGALGIAKALLYAARKVALARRGADWRPAVSALRFGVGLVVPALLAVLSGPHALLVVCVLAGELVDRCELYEELDVMTPRLQMDRVLALQTGSFEGRRR